MDLLCLKVLFLLCFTPVTETNTAHLPRMIVRETETSVNRLLIHGKDTPVRILLKDKPNSVTLVGQRCLKSFSFQNPQKDPVGRTVVWEDCKSVASQKDCHYNITVFHTREETDQLFLCGSNTEETLCCNLVMSEESSVCTSTEPLRSISRGISHLTLKEGEPSVLVESAGAADLYITYSGLEHTVGIHKFGRNKVGPSYHNKEQHYVGLVLSRRQGDSLQDRIYAFYNEKNSDRGMDAAMWRPFVSQVCMADRGGSKNKLQFSWTSQMSARLYCGDRTNRQHYSELVGVATVSAGRWQDTRVYGLFRNQWGFSAVCVYTIGDIDSIFMKSPFKGDSSDSHTERPRKCVPDSMAIPLQILKVIEATSEVEDWVQPLDAARPLLFSHHHYKHIAVDSFLDERKHHHTILFLSLQSGGVHKVMENHNETFLIAEFRPFQHGVHIHSMTLQPSSRRLYVSTGREVVQLDVSDCVQYGDSCEECILARDPYCGWNGTDCTPHGTQQDVTRGNHKICKSNRQRKDASVAVVNLPPQSNYFLQCPVSSHHGQYTWQHHNQSTSCSWKEKECLLLIDSVGPEKAGNYTCVFEEKGFQKILKRYRLQVKGGAAAPAPNPVVWICLIATVVYLSCQ